MQTLRKSAERGFADHGWLKSWHSFSFANYFDPNHLGFRQLKVINQDIVQPGQGFPTHGHANMEIITVVLRGTIEHKDSMGNKEQIKSGEIQRMSAGTGVRHSEFNPSPNEELELLQIWIEPAELGINPSYEQASMVDSSEPGLKLLVAPFQQEAPVHIHQDIRIYQAILTANQSMTLPIRKDRHGWIQMISGTLQSKGTILNPGDGLALSHEDMVQVQAIGGPCTCLVFDLI